MEIFRNLHLREIYRRRAVRRHRITLLELRCASSPFDLPEIRFQKLFKIDKQAVRRLISRLELYSQPCNIPFEIQVLTALHFYGNGSYQVSVGSNHILALSQPSVSRSIKIVTNLINNHLMESLIEFPNIVLKKAEIKEGFYSKYSMKNIIGAIDGCHVAIIGPPENDEHFRGNVYRNRKGFHSINVLICCDSQMRVTYADARFPGSVHDSAIWLTSPIRKHLQQLYTTVQRQNGFLIGDSGFPLEPWILTPFSTTTEGTSEYFYNQNFIRARNIIEKCFGVIKSRFRCLSKQRVLNYNPTMAGKIIYAVLCLHNICMGEGSNLLHIDDDDDDYDEENEDVLGPNTDHVEVRQWHTLGAQVRQQYIQHYFNNDNQ